MYNNIYKIHWKEDDMNNIPFIIISVLTIIYIVVSIRKNRLSVAASFGWTMFCLSMLFFSIFPKSLDWLSASFGIAYPPALFFTICIVVLFISNFRDDKKIDELEKKINNLAEELSIKKGDK